MTTFRKVIYQAVLWGITDQHLINLFIHSKRPPLALYSFILLYCWVGRVSVSQPIYHICIVCVSLIRILNILCISVCVCGHRWQ